MEKERPGNFVAWLLQMKSQNIRKRKTINFMNDREKGLLKKRSVITFSPQHKHVPAPMNINVRRTRKRTAVIQFFDYSHVKYLCFLGRA